MYIPSPTGPDNAAPQPPQPPEDALNSAGRRLIVMWVSAVVFGGCLYWQLSSGVIHANASVLDGLYLLFQIMLLTGLAALAVYASGKNRDRRRRRAERRAARGAEPVP